MLEQITQAAGRAAAELMEAAGLCAGELFVVGCSSSEIGGNRIGSASSLELAEAVFAGIYPVINQAGIYLAAQCCEHLNRALILEREAAIQYGYEPVNVVPWQKGGGSFATVAYRNFKSPVAVEEIRAKAGMDIGNTLIGMHLAKVAVPVRLSIAKIGEANLVCARTRPKFIGGERARYDETMK